MTENLHEKKNKRPDTESNRLSQKEVDKMLKKSNKAALKTARDGYSSYDAGDKSASVIHVKDPRDLLKFGASAVKKQVNYVKKNLEKSQQKTFEEFIHQQP